VICLTCVAGAQPLKVAIIDFDNISGIPKYDGLGKAMSSMLISDIESNVSPKRLQLIERAQINKILKEQNLQKTISLDKSTAVRTGKLLGVGYLLVGDIYILDNTLVINARLTDVLTGDIKFSEKQEGKINDWLMMKTKLGKAVALSLSMPFTDPRIPDAIITPAVLTTYASAIEENDNGNFTKAETLINTAKDYNPEFGYLDDLREDLERLKKQVAEQGNKIQILEKSGGRVINAKSYEELKLNLENPLTTFEEKKKIFIQIVNFFPDKLQDDEMFFSLFSTKYNLRERGLSECNLLLNDILKSRELVKKESFESFDRSIYIFLGWSLQSASSKIYFKHDFLKDHYSEFKRLFEIIIKNAFKETNKQLFAKFIILSQFNQDLKQFNEDVKKDIVLSQKNILDLLNISFREHILNIINNSNLLTEDFIKTNLLASQELLVFLSARNSEYRAIIKLYRPISLYNADKDAYKYFYENNADNQLSNNNYKDDIKYIFNHFFLPSFDNQNPFFEVKGDEYLNEIPEVIQINEIVKKAIIELDSSTRRYTRIMNSLKEFNIQDPCRISELKNWYIRQSDSIALSNYVYVCTNKYDIGSAVNLVLNGGSDTISAYVLGKKVTNTNKMFEVINNVAIKNINTKDIIKYYRKWAAEFIDDLVPTNIDMLVNKSNQEEIENSFVSCEEKIRREADQKVREAYFKKQAEDFRRKKEQNLAAFNKRIYAVLDIFKLEENKLDTVVFYDLLKKVKANTIGLDSVFSLAFHLLSGDDHSLSRITKLNNVSAIQLSILLNIYFIEEIENRNIDPLRKRNWIYAAIINLAHGYLISAVRFGVSAFQLAAEEYRKVPENFKFDESFNSYDRNSMISLDWHDFISKAILNRSHIEEFTKEYNILIKF